MDNISVRHLEDDGGRCYHKEYYDKTVLVVTHGGTSITCGYYFCGPPKTDKDEYFCRNCVVKEYNK